MAQVAVSINGKTFRMACEDGEEDHLLGLANRLDAMIGELREAFGEIGDQRLTVMSAIMALDQLHEAERRVDELEARPTMGSDAGGEPILADPVLAERLLGIAETVERLAVAFTAAGRTAQ
jgi:cell division protein ZapA